MRTSETGIEKDAREFARNELGMTAYKFVSPGNRAVPDSVFYYKGSTLFIEFKTGKKKPTPAQTMEHNELRQQGFDVWVINDLEVAKCVLRLFKMDISEGADVQFERSGEFKDMEEWKKYNDFLLEKVGFFKMAFFRKVAT